MRAPWYAWTYEPCTIWLMFCFGQMACAPYFPRDSYPPTNACQLPTTSTATPPVPRPSQLPVLQTELNTSTRFSRSYSSSKVAHKHRYDRPGSTSYGPSCFRAIAVNALIRSSDRRRQRCAPPDHTRPCITSADQEKALGPDALPPLPHSSYVFGRCTGPLPAALGVPQNDV
ncbi:hypothetical protein C8R45DRAFT_322125 [Mycena sanguinolenta]|nr:hypothetical protein C8R45DRAFT_322125 [Mycena sanguinolenta]